MVHAQPGDGGARRHERDHRRRRPGRLEANVIRYRHFWDECQGTGALTEQGREPKVGLTTHIVLAATEEEAVARAEPAWADYRWNLGTPRRLEAERRKLTQFLNQPGTGDFEGPRPERHMALEERRDLEASLEQMAEEARTARAQRRKVPSPIPGIMCGTPETIAPFMDEYMTTGANYMLLQLPIRLAVARPRHGVDTAMAGRDYAELRSEGGGWLAEGNDPHRERHEREAAGERCEPGVGYGDGVVDRGAVLHDYAAGRRQLEADGAQDETEVPRPTPPKARRRPLRRPRRRL